MKGQKLDLANAFSYIDTGTLTMTKVEKDFSILKKDGKLKSMKLPVLPEINRKRKGAFFRKALFLLN